MKFKTTLSLSAALFMLLPSATPKHEPDTQPIPQETFEPLPDLKISTDTIVYSGTPGINLASGVFLPTKNQIKVFYFTPADTTPNLTRWCEAQNNSIRTTFRHEFEHARKAHLVQDVNNRTPYERAQIAIMNEAMAAASEIIEATIYRQETGKRFPVNRGCLFKADSMITKQTPFLCNLGFHTQAVADIILRCAIDGFVIQYSKGRYHKKVRDELRAPKHPKYIPHNRCDFFISPLFMPQFNEWGALWTFDIAPINQNTTTANITADKVDIWNTASESARQYVLQKVDSCIYTETPPGQMLQKSFFVKTH